MTHEQPPLVPAAIAHEHARELQEISCVLDHLADAASLVHADLIGPRPMTAKGRKGMTADQVLRALVIKQMNGFSYEELAFHLAGSTLRDRAQFAISRRERGLRGHDLRFSGRHGRSAQE